MKVLKCTICGKEYEMCLSCSDKSKLKPWKIVTDTAEHFKIYSAIHGYTISGDKEQAKKELSNCDLSDLKNFNIEIQNVIKEIMAENKKNKIVSKKEAQNLNERGTNKKDIIE